MKIHTLGACELRQKLDQGELSSRQIVEALIARSREVDGKINAFVHRFDEQALRDAEAADVRRERGESLGPLDGLPISVKENVDTAGVASTLGIVAWKDRIASRDAVVVGVARRGGAVVLGKTNVPQTLLSPIETTNAIWGATNNPWSLRHAPGGSSGGEAAAIASGQSVLGIGTDIGGSIRAPAAYCGIVGLKPTAQRWSNVGSRGVLPGQETIRSQIGPLARHTADLELMLRAMDSPLHGAEDPLVPPLPIAAAAEVDLRGLRVGVYDHDGFLTPASSVRRAVEQAADSLRDAGADVVAFEPPDTRALIELYFSVMTSDGLTTLKRALAGEPIIDPMSLTLRLAKVPDAARPGLARGMSILGEGRLATAVGASRKVGIDRLWELTAERSERMLVERAAWRRARIDAVLCPATATPPVPQGMSKDFTLSFCYAARYNVLHMPAGVVPVTRVRHDETARVEVNDRLDKRASAIEERSAGLPVSVQVVAPWWREQVVLAVMRAIEQRARERDDFPRTPVDP